MRTFSFAAVFMAAMLGLSGAASAETPPMTVCGALGAYYAPTATADGSIVIGSRTHPIVRGAQESSLDPVARQTGAACITGHVTDMGAFMDYGAGPMVSSACGTVRIYNAPTAIADGSLSLGAASSFPLPIPRGTTLPADSASGYRCFSISLNAAGDAVVTGRVAEPTVEVGTAPQVSRPQSLPSTGTSSGALIFVLGSLLLAAGAAVLREARPLEHKDLG
jgi:LPXTG-motif cell wall-anchored protein